MAPAGVNNSARELMAAIKRSAVIKFDTVTAMRAVTVSPQTTDRYVLLSSTGGVQARFYQWLDTKTGADNGTTIVSPTAFPAGAFEEVGARTDQTDSSFSTMEGNGIISVSGSSRVLLTTSDPQNPGTISDITGGFDGQMIVLIATGDMTFGFTSGGTLRGNWGAAWVAALGDMAIGVYIESLGYWSFIVQTIIARPAPGAARFYPAEGPSFEFPDGLPDRWSLSSPHDGFSETVFSVSTGAHTVTTIIDGDTPLVMGALYYIRRAFTSQANPVFTSDVNGNLKLGGVVELFTMYDTLILYCIDGVNLCQVSFSVNA